MLDKASGENVTLHRVKVVFKYDAWVVPYDMLRKGRITYLDDKGKSCTVNVDKNTSFSRQG